jgi:hypothetical protein
VGAQQQAGWGFQILPYIEGDNAWKAGPLVAIGTPNKVFFCPARRAPQTITYSDPGFLNGQVVTHALCDYAASNMEGTGVVTRFTPTRIADITDGTSTTLVVADKRLNLAQLGQRQHDDNEGYTSGWDEDTIRRTNDQPSPDYFATIPDGDGGKLFGSSHTAGFCAAFADGSVHFLHYTIDNGVWRRLGDKSDGEVVSDVDF